ncbi:MAG TPA: DUF6265 family protein [Kofleriaceae bacterium]|nr:DUF6265 family protein [Kofleriaceae bacterium]
MAWLEGSWVGDRGDVVEHWTAAGPRLVGVGFGVDGGATRSFEIMTIAAGSRGRLAFTARPRGGSPVVFPEEGRGDDWVVFANPQHDFPQKVAYRGGGDRLIAHVEGAGGQAQDWQLHRRAAARDGDIERAARAAGDAPSGSALSPAGDLGFTLSPSRLTVWRLRTGDRTWQPVAELSLR